MEASAPFVPGDKVMRVDSYYHPDKIAPAHLSPSTSPVFGKVYCVMDCWHTEQGWQLFLIGFGPSVPIINGYKTGWLACNFRKIEEIKESIRIVEAIRVHEPIKEAA